MIIRSQDKSKITNFNQVSDLVVLKSKKDGYDIVACYPYFADSDCGYSVIATYSTEEKAIKVLDEIFRAFRNMAFVDMVTYQMPQDNEVR